MKTNTNIALFSALLVAGTMEVSAQGLFAKAAEQGNQIVAVYESIWDSYYEKYGELLVAEAMTGDGNLEFDTEHGLAHFPIQLKINEEAYSKWLSETEQLLEAAGIKTKDEKFTKTLRIGGKYYKFPDNAYSEIIKACESGEISIPRIGVIVELLNASGDMLQYAGLPLGIFKETNRSTYPLRRLSRGKDEESEKEEAAYASVSFAGLTRKSLLDVDKIKCRVLVDPEFTKECRRLALAKIEADNKVFAEHGIETKTIMLPGGVPLAVNKTPRGLWFCRYEVTQDQFEAVCGANPSFNPSILLRQLGSSGLLHVVPPEDTYLSDFDKSDHHYYNAPDMPVDYISYPVVLMFISALNQIPAVRESGLFFALPKGRYYHPDYRWEYDSHWNHGEPDWEYACVAGKTFGARALQEQRVRFGFDLDGHSMECEETAWNMTLKDGDVLHAKFGCYANRSDFLHPVGMKRPNAFGLYDMIGNAGEIVERIDDAGGDGIVKGSQDGETDFTESSCFYIKNDDSGRADRGFRLCAQVPGESNNDI